MLALLWINALWQLYAIGSFLGASALAIAVASKTLISEWFTKNQGLAIGIAMLGLSAAGVLTPLIVNMLIDTAGWRMTAVLMSLGIWVIAIPFFLLTAQDVPRPAIAPAHLAPAAPLSSTAAPALSMSPESRWARFADIRADRSFWLMLVALFLIGFVDQGMSQHTVLYLDKDVGLGGDIARAGFSLTLLLSAVGKMGFGWVFDRWSIRGIQACWLMVAASVALAYFVNGIAMMIVFALFRGPSQGGILVDLPVMCKHCYGPAQLAKLIGISTCCLMIGEAIGAAIPGYMYDYFGSYDLAFALMFIFSCIAVFLLFGTPPKYREGLMQPAPTGPKL